MEYYICRVWDMRNEDKISEVRRSVDIVDIISEYIPVIKSGRNYFAVCPFHDDHNPSMSISPEKQIYTCFSCGAHGNVFNFVMNYENISFYEAVKKLADKVGISLSFSLSATKSIRNPNEDIYNIYDVASKYYQNNILTNDGVDALEYLYKRGFTNDIIKTFGVGLSTRNSLTKVLNAKNYSEDVLVNSGISYKTNGNIYDTFTNRIMFPLWDLEGKVVGFSGRVYKSNDNSKYINTKESEIFKKGKLLYNYHRAIESCRKKKSVIIVEGFMDVIALYMVGIYNVVASMGTAITPEQARLLKKLSSNVILCFDGDKAGNKATMACAKELDKIDIRPKVVRLPDDLDPDEFIKKYGKDKIMDYLENPKSLLDYKIDEYKKETNFSDSEDVSKYIKNILLELSYVDDKLIREITIKKLSDETNVSIATLNGMLKVKKKPEKPKNIADKKRLSKYEKSERMLIYYMLRSKEVIKIYENNKCYFPTQEFRYLVSELVHYFNKNDNMIIADFITYLSDKKELLDAFNEVDTMNVSENYTYEQIMDYIDNLKEYSIKNEIKKLTYEFKKETDEIKKIELLKQISELKVRV